MRDIVKEYQKKFRRNHQRARRYTALLLALALTTSLFVNWQLHGVGIAKTAEYLCGELEHEHTAGTRRVGKTTIQYQMIDRLLKKGVPPQKILFVSMDHPMLKLSGLNDLLEWGTQPDLDYPFDFRCCFFFHFGRWTNR